MQHPTGVRGVVGRRVEGLERRAVLLWDAPIGAGQIAYSLEAPCLVCWGWSGVMYKGRDVFGRVA